MMKSLDDLNSKVFREQLNTKFNVNMGGQPLALELVEIAEKNDSPRIEFFSLHFLGPVRPILPQQIHRLEHEKLDTFEIFMTPISADSEGTVYEAIFHRFRKQP